MQKDKLIKIVKMFLILNIGISSVGLFVNTMNLFDRLMNGLPPGLGSIANDLSFMQLYGNALFVSIQFVLVIFIYFIFIKVLDLILKNDIFSNDFLLWTNRLIKIVAAVVTIRVATGLFESNYFLPNIWEIIRHSKLAAGTYTSFEEVMLRDAIFMKLASLTNMVTLHITPMNGFFFIALLLVLKQHVQENMKLKTELESVI
jgi:hypothetical protein